MATHWQLSTFYMYSKNHTQPYCFNPLDGRTSRMSHILHVVTCEMQDLYNE